MGGRWRFCPLWGGIWQCLEIFLTVMIQSRGAPSIGWPEAQDAAEPPTRHRAAPTASSSPAKVSSAEAEKPAEGRSSLFHLLSCVCSGCGFSEGPLLVSPHSVLPLVGLVAAIFVKNVVFVGLRAELFGGPGGWAARTG